MKNVNNNCDYINVGKIRYDSVCWLHFRSWWIKNHQNETFDYVIMCCHTVVATYSTGLPFGVCIAIFKFESRGETPVIAVTREPYFMGCARSVNEQPPVTALPHSLNSPNECVTIGLNYMHRFLIVLFQLNRVDFRLLSAHTKCIDVLMFCREGLRTRSVKCLSINK